ncbi:apurinic/apyrimidinic endonuclease family protein [Psychromonas ingrahamii]|uniref:hypothetical protein n=1 Tax=Psychromonas ingrahamii TaxID=357794 RepID=UPI0000D809E1|nr:hypothetical protein [Psychromonas ingrahamii]
MLTKNQLRWQAKPLDTKTINKLKTAGLLYHFLPPQILPHALYLINMGHPQQPALEKSKNAFLDEIQRCEQLGITENYLGEIGN